MASNAFPRSPQVCNFGPIEGWCFENAVKDFYYSSSLFRLVVNLNLISTQTWLELGNAHAISFLRSRSFNQDSAVAGTDVSQVANLDSTFGNARSFNQDNGGWNASKVTNLSRTFTSATSFNQDIGGWNVSQVTNSIATFLMRGPSTRISLTTMFAAAPTFY